MRNSINVAGSGSESAEQKALFATIAETLKKSPRWFSKAAARAL